MDGTRSGFGASSRARALRVACGVPLFGAALAPFLGLSACEIEGIRPGAEGLLSVLADVTPEEAAAWSIDPYDADKRYRGTLKLATYPFAGEPVYIKLFVDNIKDPDAGVRTAATRALGNHGGPEHVPLLVKSLQDEDKLVRAEGARALQRVHNPVAIPALINAIDEAKELEVDVRSEAADALGQYADNRVVSELIKALADPSLAVNYATLGSLRTLTGQDFGLDRVAWRKWVDSTQDAFAARSAYVYPVFRRDRKFYEYLPMVPKPPNEPEGSSPVGMPPMDGR